MKVATILSLIPFALGLLGPAHASDINSPAGSPVVLEIGGTKITAEDVDRKIPGRLLQARFTHYQAERKALDEFVEVYLIEQAAKAENLTVEALLDKHITKAAMGPDPSEDVLRTIYELSATPEPYEKTKVQIVERLRQARLAKAKNTYIESLKSKANVAILLAPPRTDVPLTKTQIRGSENAPVMLVEFADYECPYCQMVQPAIDQALKAFPGKVAFAFKDVPLPMHANAPKAAEASHCAAAQGKYWEYHDLLFSSKQLDIGQLKEHAKALKLDSAAFDKCLDTGATSEIVRAQMNEANDLGLNSTPSFFVNGRFSQGNLSFEQIRQMIEEELARPPAQRTTAQR